MSNLENLTTKLDHISQLESLSFIEKASHWAEKYPLLETLFALIILVLVAYIINFIAKRIIVGGIRKLIKRMSSATSSIINQHSVISRIANIAPALVIINGIASVPNLSEKTVTLVQMAGQAAIFVFIALAISEALNVFNATYERSPKSKNKPIKGYLQLVKILLFIVCALMILGTFLNRDVFTLLAGFGAMATVLMLVFQNTILSLVASVQISSYDMVRIGDWIEMPSSNVDGDVIDMSLHSVTVQNFDKTLTSVPTNKLVTDTFKNWRGMNETGCRRIKRAIYLDQSSIRFLTEAEIEQLKEIALLKDYLNDKTTAIADFNQKLPNQKIFNQRRLTNAGTFRAYIECFLQQHSNIVKNQTLLVRQLEPTSEGLGIEIYVFVNKTNWVEFEAIQSDIFDHLMAIISEFGLKVYQTPSTSDIRLLTQSIQKSELNSPEQSS